MEIRLMPPLRDVSYPDAKSPTSFRDGQDFEEFACDLLLERLGWRIDIYRSRHYQFTVGESRQGFEFKLDSRCTETGQLSIEVAEKSNATLPDWVPSGIMRPDNTLMYVQGNHEVVFIFDRKVLKRWMIVKKVEIRTNRPTIRSFFISLLDAEQIATATIWIAAKPLPDEDVPF
jgi:hypothetical protein